MQAVGGHPGESGDRGDGDAAAERDGEAVADHRRLADLRRMKAFATALLGLAAVVFVTTLHRSGALGFVNAAAEASMVGAVADWFAVTALFRHPLGLPVPHTAIIPTRKDALGESLQEFVATHFLAEDVVRGRVAAAHVAARAGAWLADDAHAARVGDELSVAARGALRVLRDDQVVSLIEQVVLRPVLERPWSPSAGLLLARVVEDRTHDRLVDLAAVELHGWLVEHEELVTRLLLDRAPVWTPSWVDERVARRAYREALQWISEVRDDPRHRVRLAVDDALGRLAKDLQDDPDTIARAEELKERLLTHPGFRDGLASVWTTARAVLVEATQDPASELRVRTVAAVAAFGRRLADDRDLQASIDSYLEDAVGHVVSTYRDEVGGIISETVRRWDGQETSRRIELHVGRDLQFIRINGTVVGGLVGLAIHTAAVVIR